MFKILSLLYSDSAAKFITRLHRIWSQQKELESYGNDTQGLRTEQDVLIGRLRKAR